MIHIDVNSLQKGDIVYFAKPVTFDWKSKFRYPILEKKTILRVTPKKTKIVMDDLMEFTHKEFSTLFINPTTEDLKHSDIARMFETINSIKFRFDLMHTRGQFSTSKLTDKELEEVYNLITKLYDKYNKEDGK